MKASFEHGNGCYSRGCRCTVGRAARADSTRRFKQLEGFTKRFSLGAWQTYVAERARAVGISATDLLVTRGVAPRYMSEDRLVLWTTLDALCCAVGIPTALLYPEFARREWVA